MGSIYLRNINFGGPQNSRITNADRKAKDAEPPQGSTRELPVAERKRSARTSAIRLKLGIERFGFSRSAPRRLAVFRSAKPGHP
ncbi:MAG: hypothetical protein AB8B50_10410 [Pirellulaceae bacterium]